LAIDRGQSGTKVAFEALGEVNRLPGLAEVGALNHRFIDLTGDGCLDCLVLERPGAGFYERTAAKSWESFTSLNSAPNVNWDDPNLRMMDVDGDGLSDVLVTEQDALTYYPSLARFGFGAPVRAPKTSDEEKGPAIIFADSTQSIFLADISGDGLSDIVRIRNGEVCYWPNLGYAQFGPKVSMDQAPWFDLPDLFDPQRIRLADIDGSGVTDIIYLGDDGVRIYFNQSGNAWSGPEQLTNFPPADDLTRVQALDLLCNGTACLVWTSSQPGDGGHSMRYIDLMGSEKPYLLTSSRNNLGAETRISYAPSTAFYLADREAGQEWATRLPFVVQVVERVETYDWISRNLFVTRYAYHHGYYDGLEREFRGFGMVEWRDTEELGVLTQSGAFPDATNIDAASYVPPVLTKTWFHTGAYPTGRRATRIYDSEYWREPGLSDDQVRALWLPDSELPPDATGDEIHEALRSLKGAMLRQEVYALDGGPNQGQPYSVSERNYSINRVQPFGQNRHAVFFTHAAESFDLHYERTLYNVGGEQVADPRTTHGLVLDVDEFGNEKKSVSIAYGRRHDDADPLLVASDRDAQRATLVTYVESAYTNPILENDAYRPRMPADSRTYELTGYAPSGTRGRFQSSDFVQAKASGLELVYDTEIPYTAKASSGRQRRLIEQVRTLYRIDDLATALPLFSLQPRALPFASYRLSLTPDLLALYLRGSENLLPTPASVLGAQGGYVLSNDQVALGFFPADDPSGVWWLPSGRVFYSPGLTDAPAVELANALAQFFQPVRFRDPFSNDTVVTYDSYSLLVVAVQDPVANVVTATNDYRVLQPTALTDPNGNQSAIAFDALGLVAGTAVMDKSVTGPQDSIAGLAADLTQSQIDTFFADPRAQAAALLGNATSRIVYDVGRFMRPPSTTAAPLPTYAATIAREMHVSDLKQNQTSRLQVGFSYSDGLGARSSAKAMRNPVPSPRAAPMSIPAGSAAAGRSTTTRASRSGSTSPSSTTRKISSSARRSASARRCSTIPSDGWWRRSTRTTAGRKWCSTRGDKSAPTPMIRS
jgi:hypothetical protein